MAHPWHHCLRRHIAPALSRASPLGSCPHPSDPSFRNLCPSTHRSRKPPLPRTVPPPAHPPFSLTSLSPLIPRDRVVFFGLKSCAIEALAARDKKSCSYDTLPPMLARVSRDQGICQEPPTARR